MKNSVPRRCWQIAPWFIFVVLGWMLPSMSLAATGCDGNGNCYVRQGASGSGNGSDWNNACPDFSGTCAPGSLVRGATYYVAAGTYGGGTTLTFNTATSGTAVITIKAATIAVHGTATGWNNAYQGQAAFGPVAFSTDYWVFTGVYRSTATGNPQTDWQLESGYGFKINNNNNGSNHPLNSNTAGLIQGNHSTFEYVDVAGSGDRTGTYTDDGVDIQGLAGPTTPTGNTVQYCYIHDVADVFEKLDTTDQTTLQNNYYRQNQSTPAHHGEGIALRESGTAPLGNTNLTIRNNYLENVEGTGYIATPVNNNVSGGDTVYNWDIYNNVFTCNTSTYIPGSATDNKCSYAWFEIQDIGQFTGYLHLYGNTIYNVGANSTSPGYCTIIVTGMGTPGTISKMDIENNLYANCTASTAVQYVAGSITTLNRQYNGYMNSSSGSETGKQTFSAIQMTNPAADNYMLTSDIGPWTAMGAPYNKDLLGNSRTSSMGAFQHGSQSQKSSSQPNPPQGLIASVQ